MTLRIAQVDLRDGDRPLGVLLGTHSACMALERRLADGALDQGVPFATGRTFAVPFGVCLSAGGAVVLDLLECAPSLDLLDPRSITLHTLSDTVT